VLLIPSQEKRVAATVHDLRPLSAPKVLGESGEL
jgi:hypothetical protein